jgi:hypothetical protein
MRLTAPLSAHPHRPACRHTRQSNR